MNKVLSYVRDMKNPWPELTDGADILLGDSISKSVKMKGIRKRERLKINFGRMDRKASTLGKELVEIALIMLFSEKHNFVSEIRFPSSIPYEWEKNKHILEFIHLFLTGKKISLKFPIHNSKKKSKIFEATKQTPVNRVVLFSGGLDSLATYNWLKHESQKSIFVNVRLNPKVYFYLKKIKKLFRELEVYELDYNFSKAFTKQKNPGDLQQTRGFLFLATSAMIAEIYGSKEIVVGETGPIMHQPKLYSTDVVTRTTHPVLMRTFEKLLYGLFHKNISVVTPFNNSTKAEMIYSLPADIRKNHMADFDSCMVSHTIDKMCGSCYSCLVRRLSSMVVGANDAEGYIHDVFNNENVDKMIHVSPLLEFCIKIQNKFKGLSKDAMDSITDYGKEDLFIRFSEDILAGVYLLSKSCTNRYFKEFSENHLQNNKLKQKLEKRINMFQSTNNRISE